MLVLFECWPDLEQPVKEDDADELILCVSLTDDEWQCDCGRQLIAAAGLGQSRLSKGGRKKKKRKLAFLISNLKAANSG